MDGLTFLTNLFDLSRQQLYVSLTPTNVINILKLFQLHISSQLISSQVKQQWSIDMANNIINILKLFFFLFFSCSLSTSHCVNMDNLKSGDTLNSYSLSLSLSLYIYTNQVCSIIYSIPKLSLIFFFFFFFIKKKPIKFS